MAKKDQLSELMLRRKGKVLLDKLDPPSIDVLNIRDKNGYMEFMTDEMKRTVIAATVAHNMSYLGYIPSENLMNTMITDERVSQQINEYILPKLKELKGANVEYSPMYKGFPQEVMDMSDAELYINAILHYVSYGTWSPESENNSRIPLNEKVKMQTIDIGDEKDCIALFSNLLNSNYPFSPQDYADINVLGKQFNIYEAMPPFIINRENMANLAKILYENAENKEEKSAVLFNFKSQIKSPTDVLRLSNTIFGNGDATLTEKITVKKVGRPERRALLGLIEHCPHIAEDMKINRKAWVRMGEILHPGEFKQKYPKAYRAFQSMRENNLAKDVKTFNSLAESAITSGDIDKLRTFANEKPGVIARNLDRLLRDAKDPNEILTIWQEIAPKVAPALLWQVHSHFKRRCDEYDTDALRIFVTNGLKSQTKVMEDNTKKLSLGYYDATVKITENAIKEVYKNKPQMNKVYIDPEVALCRVPNGTRDAQKGSAPLAKGSRIPFGKDANIVRAFVWWTNTNNDSDSLYDRRVDIDLSAGILDKDLKLVRRCSFYNLSDEGYTHSGDITSGGDADGKGVAEFIDIDIDKIKKAYNARYFVFTVNSYTHQQYCDMPHAHFGFMERENQMEGEIFEPSTVQQLVKLNAPATAETICMFDLERREMIWMDEVGMEAAYGRALNNTIDANWQGTQMGCYKALHMEKPFISDVIRLNVEARGGEIVYNKDEADLVFALNEGIKPTDLDYFAGELIPKEVAPEYIPLEKVAEEITEEVERETIVCNQEDVSL